MFKHPKQIDFVEHAILHAFQKVGTQLESTVPLVRCQNSSGCPSRSFSSAERYVMAREPHVASNLALLTVRCEPSDRPPNEPAERAEQRAGNNQQHG